jgi:Flp pilus assembly protein protease CpaA
MGCAVYVLFVIAMLTLLAAGAWQDIATRTIPDEVNALLLVVGGAARLVQGPQELLCSGLSALMLFLLFMSAYSRGLIGGGDVKLMTAFAIGSIRLLPVRRGYCPSGWGPRYHLSATLTQIVTDTRAGKDVAT